MLPKTGIAALAGALLGSGLAPGLAHAGPPQAQVSVDEIICRYTDDCVTETATTEEEPPTRGFSFQPAAKKTVAPRPAVAPPTSVATRPAPVRPTVASSRPKPAVAVSRNDLLVSFENNSAELTDQARVNAGVFAQALQSPQLKDKYFMIAGHTNRTGGAEYNLELSRKRAEAVAAFLEANGVDRARLRLRGFGFDQPLPDRDPAAPSNRRVEASVITPE